MPEVKEREMRLKAMVLGGVVFNKGEMGYERKANSGRIMTPTETNFQDKDVLALRLYSYGEPMGNYKMDSSPELTTVMFVPLDGLRDKGGAEQYLAVKEKKFLGKVTGYETSWDSGTMGVVFSYWGGKLDQDRVGGLGGCVLMTADNAKKFQQELEQDPRVLMDLAHGVNGGVIKRWDGQPAEIKLADRVTILGNNTLGGEISQPKTTAEFPKDYNPNPLF